MNRLKRLIVEIHHRSLWQVLLIYVGGAWICYEIIDTITDRLALPEWLPVLAIILFLIGLPVVLATAFVHEVAPPTVVPAEPTPLMEAEAARVEAEAAAVHHEARRRHRFLTWRNAAATFVIVLAAWGVVATGWYLLGETEPAGVGDERPSIAALPFENRSALEQDEYFTDGIHDEILTQLYKISGLSVRGRTSVMEYRDSPKNLRQIGEELNARYLLEGAVLRAGETVRINVQLVDAERDEHLWAEIYDRTLTIENLLTVQSDVALRVADALKATLTPDERERIEARPSDDLEAYDFYLRGRHYFHQRTPDGFRRAIEEYERAIELDTAFAPAYSGLASAYGVSVTYDYRAGPDPHSAAQRSLAMADAALSLDPNQAEAYAARAYVLRYLWAPFEDVAADIREALRLQPNAADTHGWYGHLLAREGRFGESMAEHEKSVNLDPLAVGRRVGFSWDALAARQYDIALREAERGLALAPGLADPQAAKAAALLMLGRPDLCAQLDLGPYEGIRAMCLYADGKVAEASAIIDSVAALISDGSHLDPIFGSAIPAASIGTYYAWVGKAAESLDWFERAFAMSPETHLYRIFESGVFDNVRGDALFWAGIESLRDGLRARLSERG